MTDAVIESTARSRRTRGDRAHEWWTRHCGPEARDPATRAQLRRCRSTVEALLLPEAVSLARRVARRAVDSARDREYATALDLARVLAHVRADTDQHPMRAAGWPSFPGDKREDESTERPKLSEARFRRLLQTEAGEELITAFARLVAQLDGKVNVRELAEAFLDWSVPWRQERVKQHWAFQYFNAGIAIPTESATEQESDE